MRARPRHRRRLSTWLAAIAAGVVVCFLVFTGVFRVLPNPALHPKPLWTAASGKPPDEWFFRILMFPATGSAPLFDQPEGAQTSQLLERAIANTASEVASDTWIGVYEPSGPLWVRRTDLSFFPPPGQEQALLDGLSRNLQVRTKEPLARVTLSRADVPGGARFTVEIRSEYDRVKSTYTVVDGKATPEQLVIVKGKAVAFADFPNGIISAFLAMVGAVIAMGFILSRAGRARPDVKSA